MLEIDIDSVTLTGRRVLHDIHVRIHPGEFIGLLGPNGAGKTTLLRSILGLVPYHGDVTFNGLRGRHLRRAVGYVPQKHEVAWDFPINVERFILSGRADLPREVEAAPGIDALRRVDLEDLRERPIAELSGGQRQRALVARALARRPQLLLLDEPFTGVDIPTAEGLLELFRRLADDGLSIIMSSHQLSETVAATDRVLLVNRTLIEGDTSHPEPWQRAFGVGPESALLRSVGVMS